MFQRYFLIFLSGILLISCEFFKKKELSNEQVIDTIINFKSVDVFPLFPGCESFIGEEKQRICSQRKLSENLYASLSSAQIVTSKKVNDTILIRLKIDNNGLVSITEIKSSDFIQKQIPKLDSLIESGIKELPQLKPAIKRGIPVSTEFTLPIVIRN